jgi:hypothetical protein
VTLCRPLRYGLHVAPLKRGRRNPRKGYVGPPHARAGRRRDVGLVGCVSSANSGPVRPSLPLHYHPEHCCAIPGDVGAQNDKRSPRPPLYDLQPSVSLTLELAYEQQPNKRRPHHYPRSCSWTSTGSPLRPTRSTICQDGHPLRGAARHTTTCSLELCYTIVSRLPLAYKRRRRSPGRARGGGGAE